eukprot:COSAG01_NODE_369_length_18046_cov_130.301443_10_plen_114_part_00
MAGRWVHTHHGVHAFHRRHEGRRLRHITVEDALRLVALGAVERLAGLVLRRSALVNESPHLADAWVRLELGVQQPACMHAPPQNDREQSLDRCDSDKGSMGHGRTVPCRPSRP